MSIHFNISLLKTMNLHLKVAFKLKHLYKNDTLEYK